MIKLENITKKFGDIVANDNINITFKKGEVHSLLGENGAGKSTMISMIFGLEKPTSGKIYINEKEVKLTAKIAHQNSIYLLPQHFELIENSSIIDNVILTKLPFTKKIILDRKETRKQLEKICEKYGFNIDLNKKIYQLTIGQKQIVETLKMLWNECEYMIFDEPTAVLSVEEIKSFLQIILKLKKENKCIIFISHKFDEVMEVSDKITVLRKGKWVGTIDKDKTNKEELTKMMVGKGVSFHYDREVIKDPKIILEIKNLNMSSKTRRKRLKNINFTIKEGEIVGIAAIEGNGQDNLFRAIIGTKNINDNAVMKLDNHNLLKINTENRYKFGLAYVPADRHRHGLVLDLPVFSNASLNTYNTKEYYYFGLFFKYSRAKRETCDLIEKYDIRGARKGNAMVAALSGGNQQKLLIAREMKRAPKLLMLSQPTRGLDLGAIENIYKNAIGIRNKRGSVLLYSTELDELMSVCDRIMVMSQGEIKHTLNKDNFSKENIGKWMS